jgi:hypothetical protein
MKREPVHKYMIIKRSIQWLFHWEARTPRHTTRLLRLRAVWLLSLCLGLSVGALWILWQGFMVAPADVAAQEQDALTEELDVTVTPAFEGNYLPGTWLPLDIAIRNQGTAFDATLVVTLPNSPNRYTLTLEMPRGAEKRETLYVPMLQQTGTIAMSVERDGTPVWQQDIEVRPRPQERMLGIAAQEPSVLALPRRQDMQVFPFTSFVIEIDKLPDQPMGLRSMTILLLTAPTEERLTPAQVRALHAWVVGGGHLVIGGGVDAQQTLAGLPDSLHPAAIGASTELERDVLQDVAAQSHLNTAPPERPDVLTGITLEPVDGSDSVGPPDAPVWSWRSVGQGRVTQLAFAPEADAIRTWNSAPQFWEQLLQPAFQIDTPSGQQYTLDPLQELELTSALTRLPSVRLPRTIWLFGLLAAYVLVVGPGMALLLRRTNRHVQGWLLLPALIVLFGAGAFGVARALHTDERIVSHVTLAEQVHDEYTRVRSAAAFLTPHDIDLTVQAAPDALVRPLPSQSGTYVDVSGIQGAFAQHADTFQADLSAWQFEGVLAEAYRPMAMLHAQIVLDDDGTIQAHVHNLSDHVLRDVAVVYQRQVARVGDLAPGEEREVDWPTTENVDTLFPPGTALSYVLLQAELDAGRGPGNVPDRRVLTREALVNAAVTRGPNPADEGPLVLAWLEQSPLPLATGWGDTAARSQTTLLTARPEIVGSGDITLPRNWLSPDVPLSSASCFAGDQRGIRLQTTPITLTLTLPRGLETMQADDMTLTLDSSNPWPNAGVITQLYNWQQEEWEEIDFDGPGHLRREDAAPYLQDGEVRLSLDGRINEANCLFFSSELTGSLP